MWRGSAEKEAASVQRRGISTARRNVLVAGRVVDSFREKMDMVVSRKLVWPDAGWSLKKEGIEFFCKVSGGVSLDR